MDLPWIIFFIAILSMLHIWLGVAALVGALLAAVWAVNGWLLGRRHDAASTKNDVQAGDTPRDGTRPSGG